MEKRIINRLAFIALFAISSSVLAGEGTVRFKIERIVTWANGFGTKIYTNTDLVNGLQTCDATDRSIGLRATDTDAEKILSIALTAQAQGADVSAWVSGCCIAHNNKESPCIHTLSIWSE